MNRRNFLAGTLALPLAASAAVYDPSGQLQRRRQINALHQKFCARLFNDQGVWIGPPTEATPRVRFWHSMSLLDNPATRGKANAVIHRCFVDRAQLAAFSHFEYCAATQILTKQRDTLDAPNRDALLGVIRDCFERQGPIYFRGYNDNFPAMENITAVLGGEILEDNKA